MTRPRPHLGRRARRRILATLVGLVLVAAAVPQVTAAADGLTNQSGTQLGLPLTDSAMTLHGRGRFQNLAVTVNQTTHLGNQAISVTWTGGDPGVDTGHNFVQIFQCWGDDDGTNPENPGPPPEQCEFGGEPFTPSLVAKLPSGPSRVYSRTIAQDNWGPLWFDPDHPDATGYYDSETGSVWRPFRAVDGTVVDAQLVIRQVTSEGTPAVTWMNNYFDFNTTNEKPWGRTYGDGTGSEPFQVDTGLEAPGLGCGQEKLALPDGSHVMPKCWLVVVPRGLGINENPPVTSDPNKVITSPLSPQVWGNRIAFPLDFNPVDSPCTLGADERRIAGSELATGAITNWQPTLCADPGSPPYAYSAVSDDQARQQVIIGAAGAPGMAVVSRPYDPAFIDADSNPVVYAPLTLSGAVIAFNIERLPLSPAEHPDEKAITSTRIEHLNLTPRLVAKLLTQSYLGAFYSLFRPTGDYGWLASAPTNITVDPDFLRYNPEFAILNQQDPKLATLTVEAPTSDTARLVWDWILADPEAKAWLDGVPDEWGMKVNPYYATDAAANVNGVAFADPVPENFPKNDPYCYQDPGLGGIVPRPLCFLDTQPYAPTMVDAAIMARSTNTGSRTIHDGQNASQQTPNTWWGLDGPQLFGLRSIAVITDSASAARFGLPTASLSRAGDDGAGRTFVEANDTGFLAGVTGMVPSEDASVLVPDVTSRAPGAYPLTTLTYAAAFPEKLDETSRDDYAKFIEYSTGAGQTPGVEFGQLPPGYTPLPATLVGQAAAAAASIRAGVPEPTTTTTAAPGTSPTSQPSSAGATAPQSPRSTSAPATSTATTTAGAAGPPSAETSVPVSPTTAPTKSSVPVATTPETARASSLTPAVTTSPVARYAIVGILVAALVAGGVLLAVDDRWRRALMARLHRAKRASPSPSPPT